MCVNFPSNFRNHFLLTGDQDEMNADQTDKKPNSLTYALRLEKLGDKTGLVFDRK